MPEEWLDFFTKMRERVTRVTTDPPPTMVPPWQKPRMALATDDVTILLAQAEEGVLAGVRADATIQRALASAAKSEARIKDTLRMQGELQQQIDDACAATMERACAAVCERCEQQGPPVWSTRGVLHEPGHPEFDPEDGQWWHQPGGDNEGRCAAQRIRDALKQSKGCLRRPGVECDCPMCRAAIDKLAKEGPNGPGSCRDCGGYHIRIGTDPQRGWGMGCVACGNWGELPAEISGDDLRARHDDLTGKRG